MQHKERNNTILGMLQWNARTWTYHMVSQPYGSFLENEIGFEQAQ